MKTNELYLKTAFCCMACDGDIADEEIALVKKWTTENSVLFGDLNVEESLNNYVSEINEKGVRFLSEYISEIENTELSENEQLQLLTVAIKMIEADNKIEYSEIVFFKKIRFKLNVSDEAILQKNPGKEDWLLPDIIEEDEFDWDVKFENINFESFNQK